MELLNQGVLQRDDLAIVCLNNCHFACARMLASGDSRRVVLLLLIFAKEQQVFQLPFEFSRRKHGPKCVKVYAKQQDLPNVLVRGPKK